MRFVSRKLAFSKTPAAEPMTSQYLNRLCINTVTQVPAFFSLWSIVNI